MYSQSLGSTPHRKASIKTTPLCSLQNRTAETQTVWTSHPIAGHPLRDSFHLGNFNHYALRPHYPNVPPAKSHCSNTKGADKV